MCVVIDYYDLQIGAKYTAENNANTFVALMPIHIDDLARMGIEKIKSQQRIMKLQRPTFTVKAIRNAEQTKQPWYFVELEDGTEGWFNVVALLCCRVHEEVRS